MNEQEAAKRLNNAKEAAKLAYAWYFESGGESPFKLDITSTDYACYACVSTPTALAHLRSLVAVGLIEKGKRVSGRRRFILRDSDADEVAREGIEDAKLIDTLNAVEAAMAQHSFAKP